MAWPSEGRKSKLWGALPPVLLVVVAVALSWSYWGGSVVPTSDGLFYEAQALELDGKSRAEAVRTMFATPAARAIERSELSLPAGRRRLVDPKWRRYQGDLLRRRWLLPALASTLDPVLPEQRIETLSLIGFVLLGPLLYLLLRRRFGVGTSLAVSFVALLLPPVQEWSFRALTDSWGLVFEISAFLLALTVLERGLRWLPAWVLCMLALSATRDATLVLVVATAWLALHQRTRRAVALPVSGLLASLPLPLVFGASVRKLLAFNFNDYHVPQDGSWGFVLREYPHQLFSFVKGDLRYPLEFAFPPGVVLGGLLAIGAILLLLVRSPKDDAFFQLQRGAVVGSLLLLGLALTYSALRLELVLLPPAAVGLGLAVDHALQRYRRRRGARAEPVPT